MTGFAQSAHVLYLLGFLPVIGPLARFLAVVVSFFAIWVGAAAAHNLRGWRTLLLPVLYPAIAVVGAGFLLAVLRGGQYFFRDVLASLGVTP